MSSFAPMNVPEHKGRIYKKLSVKKVGQCKLHSHLRTRMKADDSAAVLMSDSKLGTGISSK
jgi:hypothetical protein